MSNSTTKKMSDQSGNNALRGAYNDQDSTLAVSGFISAKQGHKIVRSAVSPTIDTYSFYDGSTLLYTLQITYNNSSHDEIDLVERTV